MTPRAIHIDRDRYDGWQRALGRMLTVVVISTEVEKQDSLLACEGES
jgi:hypothetical protein